jgi:hypothetical protein
MSQPSRPPIPVIVAVVLYLSFGMLLAAGAALNWLEQRDVPTVVFGLGVLVVLAIQAVKLWTGSRAAWISAIVLAVVLALTTVSFPALRLVAIPLGVAQILLLTVPAGVRAFFRDDASPD